MDGIYDGTYDTTTPESIPYMLNQNPNEDMDVTHNDTTTPGSIIYMLNLNLDEDMHGNHDGTYDGPYDDTVNTNGKSTKKPGSSVITTMTHNDTEVGHKVIKKCLAWVNGSCKLIPINSNHTKCSCVNPPALSDNNKLGFNGVLPGLLHFLFLSAFVWMLIDAVLLFISARNLTKIRSRQKQILGWKSLTVIGYVIPLIVVGVSVAVIPNGYGGKKCWFKSIRGFSWSFLGPACFILAANVILFIAIFITVTFSLKGLNNEILQRTQTQDDRKLIRTVLFKTMAQFFILGCPWILGLINSSSIVLETIYVVLISQQGTFIFLVHCVLNQEVSHHTEQLVCI
ncbi:hypothetical protein MHYP_G00100600 [Metynnis hypsauchen]